MLLLGDSTELLATLPDNSIDSVVTDPPYGLSFMGKRWDYDVPSEAIWRECLRVLKPGGHLLAFAGTRTQHRMAVRIEDAGFEIRDMIAWVYGSGFPKSLDVSKAIDAVTITGKSSYSAMADVEDSKEAGLSAPDDSFISYGSETSRQGKLRHDARRPKTDAVTDAAREWQGWGTALKPALEPITVARKPLEGTVAANVLAYGTGGLNIDGCRIAAEKATGWGGGGSKLYEGGLSREGGEARMQDAGRWPANLIHDGSEEVLAGFPQTTSGTKLPHHKRTTSKGNHNFGSGIGGGLLNAPSEGEFFVGDTGSAARFFYCAKSSRKDRGDNNNHPTVKPTDLMRYLCRLVTPPGGTVLDPFMGSGSTGKAARLEGFQFIGIERDAEYFQIAQRRIEAATIQERLAV